MIDALISDFEGVLVDLQPEVSLRCFRGLDVQDIDEMPNPYRQLGVFHNLEVGLVGREGFVARLNEYAGTTPTDKGTDGAVMLFLKEVPQHKFDYLEQLRKQYKIYILPNTNPYIMAYVHSPHFLLATGRTLSDYVDKIYASRDIHTMKPDRVIYEQMIADSGMAPERTFPVDDSTVNLEAASALGLQILLAVNGMDWRPALVARLQ